MNIILVLLFIWNGQLKLIQEPMPSVEACEKAGQAIIDKQQADPRFDQGLFAGCLKLNEEKS